MERIKSWELITETGAKMQKGWIDLANFHGLDISVSGIAAMTTYGFISEYAAHYKTFITQEMLKKGYLASTHFYASIAHNDDHLKSYFEALDGVYATIAKCESEELNIYDLLEGPVCHGGFKRLN
jgi:predicted aminopeptidase